MVNRFNKRVVQDTSDEIVNIRPVREYLLVEIEQKKDEFHIPEGAIIYVPPSVDHQRMVAFGKIARLGTGVLNTKTAEYDPFPEEIEVGANAVFGKFAGTEVRVNGREYRLMRVTEIIAVY